MGAVVGIDLGTTNTVVASARDGRVAALPDESGSPLIPSIVSFLPSGAVLVGNAAKERRSQDARNTIYSVKRLIGRTWDSPEVQKATSRFPFELREGPGRATFVIARGETYTLPEISAFVLRKAKSIAELELGETVDRAVITVPASFNDLQRAATKVAGRVAGLEVLRILNEPTAAALAFGHTRGNRERIAIYDFGGGTFDLTLLLLTDDVFEVLATSGDTFLGGDDIDAAIVEQMARQLGGNLPSDLRTKPDTFERLRAVAEQLKHDLSESRSARIVFDDNEIAGSKGIEFTMTRDELDALVAPIASRTFKVCHDALTMAKLAPKDIDHVLLVGGTTRIPLVRHKLEEYFGKRARADLDPHEVVALGAAQQAMALTQVRATASGIPVAPPPRPLASPNEQPVAQHRIPELRQKTDPFGTNVAHGAPPIASLESAGQGRVTIAPPEELSRPTPTTQSFGSRDLRTTGIGLGPVVGVDPAAPGRDPFERDVALGASSDTDSISDSSVSKRSLQQTVRLDRADLPLPPTSPNTAAVPQARDLSRSTAARPVAGLSSTMTSAVATVENRGASIPETDPLFGAIVRPDRFSHDNLPVPKGRSPSETIPDEAAPPWDESPVDLDLPLVRASTPLARLTTENAVVQAKLGLPDPTSMDDDDDDDGSADEPTAIRRSAQSSHDGPVDDATSRDEALVDLPVPQDLAATRSGKTGGLNEDEIRARYGNLPLIVGGKRVGTRSAESGADSFSGTEQRRRMPSAAELDLPARSRSSLPAIPKAQLPQNTQRLSPTVDQSPVVALIGGTERDNTTQPLPSSSARRSHPSLELTPALPVPRAPILLPGIAFEPEALDPDDIEPDFSEAPSRPDSVRGAEDTAPKSHRLHSTRPSARQNVAEELELPVPDLPPPRTVPLATRPMVAQPKIADPVGNRAPAPLVPTPILKPSGSAAMNTTLPIGAPLPGRSPRVWQPPTIPDANAHANYPPAPSTPELLSTLSRSGSVRPALLIDVTPLSLCVETVGGFVDVLVARNTPVPCERTRDFVTAHDNQQSVIVRVAQGESRLFQENVLLGEVQLSGIPPAIRGQSRIAVTFGIDSDGILHVRALDVMSGQTAQADLRLSGAPSSPEVAMMMSRHVAKERA